MYSLRDPNKKRIGSMEPIPTLTPRFPVPRKGLGIGSVYIVLVSRPIIVILVEICSVLGSGNAQRV